MAEYRELSRRGLIKMCMDYDIQNKDQLAAFLNSHARDYETIRAAELAIDKADQYAGVAMEAYDSFKKTAAKDSDATCSRLVARMAGKVVGKAVKTVTGGIF